jgi:predicted DNA-binding ribbon-helix-helix protein
MMPPRTDLRPRKRSLSLRGHRTSVSLEDPFWEAFTALARQRNLSVNALAAEIDTARGLDCGLASAIRVHVLKEAQARATRQEKEKP